MPTTAERWLGGNWAVVDGELRRSRMLGVVVTGERCENGAMQGSGLAAAGATSVSVATK